MNHKRHVPAASVAAMVFLISCGIVSSATAAGEVTTNDLRAVGRSLGFLNELPHDGTIVVGIVYAADAPNGKALADRTANMLSALPGPKSTAFRATMVPVNALGQAPERLDAIFLMPGLSAHGDLIGEFVRRRHLVSISNDPACLDAKCCVLMVQTGNRVEIVLDTMLADAVGAHFSSVFTMMVKRK